MATRRAKTKKRKRQPQPAARPITAMEYEPDDSDDLDALAEDCDREMYGEDYDHLRDSGWLDR
jgi:hypothetical protein